MNEAQAEVFKKTNNRAYSASLPPLRPINRAPEGFDLLRLAFEQQEDAGGGVAFDVEASGEAAGDRHLDDRQFAGGLMQTVGGLDRADLHRDAGRVERLAAKRDHPRKRGFQASEHGENPLGLLYDTEVSHVGHMVNT